MFPTVNSPRLLVDGKGDCKLLGSFQLRPRGSRTNIQRELVQGEGFAVDASIINAAALADHPFLKLNEPGALTKVADCRIGFDQDPLIERTASVESQPPLQLWTECFEAVRTARADERNRLRYMQRISHEINALRAGFEV